MVVLLRRLICEPRPFKLRISMSMDNRCKTMFQIYNDEAGGLPKPLPTVDNGYPIPLPETMQPNIT